MRSILDFIFHEQKMQSRMLQISLFILMLFLARYSHADDILIAPDNGWMLCGSPAAFQENELSSILGSQIDALFFYDGYFFSGVDIGSSILIGQPAWMHSTKFGLALMRGTPYTGNHINFGLNEGWNLVANPFMCDASLTQTMFLDSVTAKSSAKYSDGLYCYSEDTEYQKSDGMSMFDAC